MGTAIESVDDMGFVLDSQLSVRRPLDLHDGQWVARQAPMSADASQLFLFQSREKWAPGGPPPGKGGPPVVEGV